MIATILFSSLFYACGETEEQKPKETKPVCDLNLDDLNNTSWLYGMPTGGTISTPDSKLRLKFYTEERKLKAHYNMGQATSMYTYDCVSKSNQILCSTIPDPVDVCLSFFAADKKCTRKSLEGFYRKTAGMSIDQKEMRNANIQAEEKIKEWKKKGMWEERYRRLYNSIGKRQMGLMYAKVNATACNLLITDNFAALASGEFVEDAASTVGTNPFLKHTSGELLWEGCTDTDNTVWTTVQAEVPEEGFTAKDVKKIVFSGEDTHFWLFNEKLKEAEKGAEYSYKVWLNGQEKIEEKTIKASEADKTKIDWHHTTKFDTANVKGDYNLISFQVFKKPEGGEKESVGIYCSKFQVANKTK